MQLKTDTFDDVTVVHFLIDKLDAENSHAFKDEIAKIIGDTSKLVFEMSQTNFVDSSGLGCLLSCMRKLNTVGGELKICGMTKPVKMLFEMVRVHRIFDIYDSLEQALAAFKESKKTSAVR